MLSLIPDSGRVAGKDNCDVKVYPSSQVTANLDALPWRGEVIVTVAGVSKVRQLIHRTLAMGHIF